MLSLERPVSIIEGDSSLFMKVRKYGIFAEFILGIVFLASKFVFSRIYRYFPEGTSRKLNLPYPTVYFANHVAETDVPGLSNVHCLIKKPRIQYTIPVRQDILEKNFLVNEFKPRGFLKSILKSIDKIELLPRLFRIVGAVPVKRPFRDNARAMIKDGSLRDQVDKDWQILVENVDLGKNVVLFPEGAFSDTGYLAQIKNGIFHLSQKKPDLNFFYFNFTYDFLSRKKPSIHIGFGELFKMDPSLTKDQVIQNVRERLGKIYTVTAANLSSFVILMSDIYKGKNKEWVANFVTRLARQIADSGYYVSTPLWKGREKKIIKKILGQMIKKKVLTIDKNGNLDRGQKWELEYQSDKSRKLRKERPFYYHKNQLTYFQDEVLEKIKGMVQIPVEPSKNLAG